MADGIAGPEAADAAAEPKAAEPKAADGAAELRIALTIPGAVSLGAYEAGAAAALVAATRGAAAVTAAAAAAPTVTVDAIGASSAGSVLGLLLARCVVEHLDPVQLLRRAWVEEASIAQVLSRGLSAPLDFTRLSRNARALLETPPISAAGSRSVATGQAAPVHLSVGLGNLRGLAYRLPAVSSPDHVAVTHLDWYDFTVERDATVASLTGPAGDSALDAVLASAANQLGFAARLLTRRDQQAAYEDAGVVNFPASGAFWYTDASFLDREPITRTLRAARRIDAVSDVPVRRVHVVLEPQPVTAGQGQAWADPSAAPSWLDVLRRSAGILQAQSVFDDLSGVDEVNRRLVGVEHLRARLVPLLDRLPPAAQDEWRSALAQDIGTEADLNTGTAPAATTTAAPAGRAHPDPASIEELFGRRLNQAADVVGKRRLQVEVISPELVAAGRPVDELLAGRAFFRFGGFLDQRLRQSDFDLGYASTTAWLRGGAFQRLGLTDEASDHALAAVHAAYRPTRSSSTPRLSMRGRLRLVRLAGRVGVVALRDLLAGRARTAPARPRP